MKVCLSGLTRRERLVLAEEVSYPSVVIDFSLVKKFGEEELSALREKFGWLILAYDLKSSWKRLSKSPDGLSKLDKKVSDYISWSNQNHEFFDVLALPDLEDVDCSRWESLLKTINWMVTVPLDRLESYIPSYKYLGVSGDLSLHQTKATITPLIRSLTAYSTKIHRWGAADKETVLSGQFWSCSSPNWLASTRYGVTYNYVGNLKLTLGHGKKGSGKSVRLSLKSKCENLGIDHQLFVDGDNPSVLRWTIHQWKQFSEDADRVSGYWAKRSVKTTEIASKSKTELASPASSVGYLRTCNSCFLSAQCPAFEPDTNCKITTTPKVDTPDDVQNLLNLIVQVQSERVLFGAFAEKVQNAGINPEVSRELETLTKLMKDAKEIASPVGGDEVFIKAKGSGVISRLFGSYGRSGGGTKPSTSETIIDVSPIGDKDETL